MKSQLTQKTNFAFFQMASVAFLVVAAISLFALKIYEEANIYLGVLYHHIKTACGCTDIVQFLNMHPVIFAEVAVLAVIVTSFAMFSAYKLLKLYNTTRRFTKHCLKHSMKKQSWKLKTVFMELGIKESRITEIRSEEPAVFCYGLLRPKICISSSLVKMLDKGELKSVLLHEKHHMESYEPLKLFIVMYLRNTLFVLPGIKKLAKKYFIFSELSADEAACSVPFGKSKLAGAIFKISGKKSNFNADVSSPALTERVNRLIDEAYIPGFKNLRKSFAACFIAFVLVSMYAFSVLSNSSQAYEMHGDGACSDNGEKEYDFIGGVMSDQKTCAMNTVSHQEMGECRSE